MKTQQLSFISMWTCTQAVFGSPRRFQMIYLLLISREIDKDKMLSN